MHTIFSKLLREDGLCTYIDLTRFVLLTYVSLYFIWLLVSNFRGVGMHNHK